MTNRLAQVQISVEILEKAIFLPEGAKIIRLRQRDDFNVNGGPVVIEAVVEWDKLMEIPEGMKLPLETPTVTRHEDGTHTFTMQGITVTK